MPAAGSPILESRSLKSVLKSAKLRNAGVLPGSSSSPLFRALIVGCGGLQVEENGDSSQEARNKDNKTAKYS